MDYFGRWKALHYLARRFFAPVLLSVEDSGTKLKVVLNNDTHALWDGKLRWTLETVDGKLIDSGEKPASCAPHLASVIETFEFAGRVTPDNRRDIVFVCELWQKEERISLVVMPFVPDKHLNLADPQFETSLTLEGSMLAIRLNTQSLARFVELAFDGADVIFSDNDFDLPANRETTVTCPLPEGWTLAMAAEKLKVISVNESYA
jgi:beta-mannosidase